MEDLQELQKTAQALHESGDDSAALDAYLRLIEQAPPQSAAGLWLRVGGIQQSLGQAAPAADSYQRALEGFASAGLSNLALVAAQRLLGADPGRTDAYLRFGQICAEQGYPRDARHGYVEFAERMAGAGRVDEAVRALREYLQSFPDDMAMRRRLGELGGSEPQPAAAPEPDPADLDLMPAFDRAAEPGPEREAPAQEDPSGGEPEVLRLEGFEPTHAEVEWSREDRGEAQEPHGPQDDLPLEPAMTGLDQIGSPPLPPREPASRPEEDEIGGDLPLLDFGEPGEEPLDGLETLEDGGALPELEPLPGWESFSIDESAPLPELGGAGPTGEEAEEEAEPLPSLEPVLADPLAGLRDRLVIDADDVEAHQELVELLDARGDREGLGDALQGALSAYERMGRIGQAADAARRLAELRPSDPRLLERWAGLAAQAEDPLAEIPARLALARAYEERLDRAAANAAYRRVLELDPDHEEARRGVGPVPPAATDYVDLGALIFNDEPEPEATRFQVDAEQPSGNEQQDFEEILGLFRQKVTENIDPKDAASHYDLGLAFKEMGLLDDAVAQLQRALRGGSNPLATLEVLGECFLEKSEHGMAARVLERATRLHNAVEADLVGVYYWLGRAQESLGDLEQARGSYERVIAVDIGFRDAGARLQALRAD